MKKLFSVFLAVFFLFISCAAFSSAADYSISVPSSSYFSVGNLFAFAFAGTDGTFDYISFDGNNFSYGPSESGKPVIYFNLPAYAGSYNYSACDVFTGFTLDSVFSAFPLSGSTFHFSANIESWFDVSNRPDEVAVIISSSSNISKVVSVQIDPEGFYKLNQTSIIDTFRTLYTNPSSGSVPIYGFASSSALKTSGSVNLECDVVVPSGSGELTVLFVSYKKGGANFYNLPLACYITPTGNSLSDYRSYLQQQEIISQNNEIISGIGDINSALNGEGESYSKVDTSDLDEYESLEDSLNKDFSGDLSKALNQDIFTGNGAFIFIKNTFEDVLLSNPVILGLILFALSMGLVALILGRKVGT